MAIKLKPGEVEAYKLELLNKQGWRCPICGASLRVVKPLNRVLDHCHRRGFCREVLCRGCNGGIGKVEQLIQSYCKAGDNEVFIIQTLRNIADYLEKHKVPQTDRLYHKHKTPAELREARNRKARLAYAAKKGG